MLRVETKELNDVLICQLEGRLTGEGAEQVRTLVTHCDSKLQLIVDLTEVMFIDAVGEHVLLFLRKLGGEFVAETAYSRDICERLDLPLVDNHQQNSHVSGNGKSNGRGQILANGDCQS
jgi:hypothetical protein